MRSSKFGEMCSKRVAKMIDDEYALDLQGLIALLALDRLCRRNRKFGPLSFCEIIFVYSYNS